MYIFVLIGFIFLFIYFVPFRIFIFNPFKSLYYMVVDLYQFIRFKKYNILDGGLLNCYTAHFGGGKTLSIVQYIVSIYQKKNNRPVYDFKNKKWLVQRVIVLSNVDFLTIPYVPLTSLGQVVEMAKFNKQIDEQNNTRTVVLVVIDEASCQLNSRNFKTNIDPLFLNTLITSRHYHISFFYSSQKFKLTDALLRSVTQRCIACKKIWRFVIQYTYSADELEYASDPSLVKPIKRGGWFCSNHHFDAYDTLACVGNLEKSVNEGDMMDYDSILSSRNFEIDNDSIIHPSGRFKRLMKKRR